MARYATYPELADIIRKRFLAPLDTLRWRRIILSSAIHYPD